MALAGTLIPLMAAESIRFGEHPHCAFAARDVRFGPEESTVAVCTLQMFEHGAHWLYRAVPQKDGRESSPSFQIPPAMLFAPPSPGCR